MRVPNTVKYLKRTISVVGKLETSVCIMRELVVIISAFAFLYEEKPKRDSKNPPILCGVFRSIRCDLLSQWLLSLFPACHHLVKEIFIIPEKLAVRHHRLSGTSMSPEAHIQRAAQGWTNAFHVFLSSPICSWWSWGQKRDRKPRTRLQGILCLR